MRNFSTSPGTVNEMFILSPTTYFLSLVTLLNNFLHYSTQLLKCTKVHMPIMHNRLKGDFIIPPQLYVELVTKTPVHKGNCNIGLA